ncbi:cytochrome P450 [Amycolatopsis sp. YIM 10]|uniref:cytochrome P450 n=1 Tax=Amycolatopsis sp. YIM 10 TaxID=2653857 RepID=UPI0012900625|nr:cytochrome P450 [Amycolatopsis sp. YIM 10]QFU85378.1 6-deoxyerythronolide B hydroxylase [Amycolatopsis sp. YIM 10]
MFEPADPAFLANPYPYFAELRAKGAVHHHEGLGLAIAVSHPAASAVLRHRSLGRIWRDATPAEQFVSFNLLHRNSLLENEPPAHTRLRRLVSSAFARGHVERLRPRVEQVAAKLVDRLAARIRDEGQADFLAEVAQPLPVEVIAELLGVPEADRPLLVPWSNHIVKMYEYGLSEDKRAMAEQAAGEFVDYLRKLSAERAANPGDDLISDLVRVRDDDNGRLSDDELVATAVLLLMAGHEATVNVLGNGLRALLDHRDQWELLPSNIDTAVEEAIRFDSPLQLFERTATEDVEIAGYRLEAGRKIGALLGAAARDPEVFAEPDSFDIRRSPNPHLGFGAGIHFCLGAPLARVEIAAAFRALTALPALEPAGEPPRRPEFVMRGYRELPVTGVR